MQVDPILSRNVFALACTDVAEYSFCEEFDADRLVSQSCAGISPFCVIPGLVKATNRASEASCLMKSEAINEEDNDHDKKTVILTISEFTVLSPL